LLPAAWEFLENPVNDLVHASARLVERILAKLSRFAARQNTPPLHSAGIEF
jgi:hypothetical protein